MYGQNKVFGGRYAIGERTYELQYISCVQTATKGRPRRGEHIGSQVNRYRPVEVKYGSINGGDMEVLSAC